MPGSVQARSPWRIAERLRPITEGRCEFVRIKARRGWPSLLAPSPGSRVLLATVTGSDRLRRESSGELGQQSVGGA